MFRSYLKSMQTNSQNAQNPGLWVNGMRQPMHEAVKPVDPDADTEVTPDEANMHADAAAAQTETNRLGSEIGQHPEDVDADGAVTPEERRLRAAAAAANVSSDSWASMAAQHISGETPRATPAPVGNDAY